MTLLMERKHPPRSSHRSVGALCGRTGFSVFQSIRAERVFLHGKLSFCCSTDYVPVASASPKSSCRARSFRHCSFSRSTCPLDKDPYLLGNSRTPSSVRRYQRHGPHNARIERLGDLSSASASPTKFGRSSYPSSRHDEPHARVSTFDSGAVQPSGIHTTMLRQKSMVAHELPFRHRSRIDIDSVDVSIPIGRQGDQSACLE